MQPCAGAQHGEFHHPEKRGPRIDGNSFAQPGEALRDSSDHDSQSSKPFTQTNPEQLMLRRVFSASLA